MSDRTSLTRLCFGAFEVLAVPVLRDNLVYLVCRDGEAVLVDAGKANPIFQALEENGLHLQKVLITHAHHDHVGGCRKIQDRLGVQSVSPSGEAGWKARPTYPACVQSASSISSSAHHS